jgi:hypothetical protein
VKRIAILAGVAVLAAALLISADSRSAPAARAGLLGPDGPTLTIGAPSVGLGGVEFQVMTTGAVPNAYNGFHVHIRFDPTLFSYGSAEGNGGLFDPLLSFGICQAAVVDADQAGFTFGCTGLTQTTAGVLATIDLTASIVNTGCSLIHFYTFGPPDNGDATTGSYTDDTAGSVPQQNAYQDNATDTSANVCTPGAAPTATSTATATPSPTNTAAATATMTPTATSTVQAAGSTTPVLTVSTATPTSTPTAPAVATATPPPAPTLAAPKPGGGVLPSSGAPGAKIQLPNTGLRTAGGQSGGRTAVAAAIAALIAGVAILAAGTGCERRRHTRGR